MPIEQAMSFKFALTLKAVVFQRIGGGTETKFVPHMTLVGETAPEPPEEYGDDSDDIPF